MQIEYTLPFRRGGRQRTFLTPPAQQPDGRAPRPARMWRWRISSKGWLDPAP